MLRHLEHQVTALILDRERVQNGGQIAVEMDVDHGAQHLRDLADEILGHE